MTDDRKKIKDLATELGIAAKDVLAAAKDLGISSAKVTASSLSEQEISKVRNHFIPQEPRENVRVRRRRASDDGGDATDTAPVAEAAPAASAAESAPAASVRKGPPASAVVTPPPAARIIKKAADTVQPPATPEPAKAEPVAPKATVVTPPAEPKVVRPATVEKPREGSRPSSGQTSLAQPSSGAKVDEKTADSQPEAPMAKVVMPHTSSAEAKATVQEAPAAPAATKKPAAKPGMARVVEQPAAPQDETEQAKKGGARIVRPAAFSAEPERGADGQAVSSAPVLASKSDAEKGDDDEAATSQVRVISRPDPAQARNEGRDSRDYRDGRDYRDNRGGQDRQAADRFGQPRFDRRPGGATPRPAGNAPRPTGGAPRPAGGAPRPAGNAPRPGGYAPAGNNFTQQQQPVPDSAESRKKRQKGRRTVDFSAGTKRGGEEEFGWSKASGGRKGKGRKREQQPVGGTQPQKAVKRKIKVEEFIRVSDLAHQMGLKAGEIIKALFNLGVMATINNSLDIETATLVAIEYGYEIEKVGFSEEDFIEAQHLEDDPKDLRPRPPVVTIMGHVDHGKTSLLDAIRKSSVVSGEAGGITQHIGAYHVSTKRGEIVFLDTPGHEAFTAMRARGAEVTDIVVLVVAADDGVMEQTREAINHAKAAKVPIMVAVNKIDKPGAEPDRVKRELSEQGLIAEDWGGDTTFVHVSAKTRQGLDDLLELLALQAEILELKANPAKLAIGHIVEAKLDKGRGALGTVLIQQGTLRLGDTFVCGTHSGRVRAMFNDQGKKVKEATPSMPVEVQGFEGVPEAGEEFICLPDEKNARRIAETRAIKQRERDLARDSGKITLETFLSSKAGDAEAAVLNLVVKADVQGSLEAIIDAMNKQSTEKVRINVIHGGTGAISESDILLSAASSAIVIGFNVRPTAKARELAEQEKIDIRFYDIIYKLVDELKNAMEGLLAPVEREVILGSAEVRELFSVPKIGTIAGCHVSDGKIVRNCHVRLLRDGVVYHTGRLGSLRRFKDDVREVMKGYECGIGIENYNDLKLGDVVEAFEVVEEAATL